jgi:penicillin-binding protein 1A
MIAEVLEGNVRSGTGRRAQIEGHHAAGKTGTTTNHYDAWFVGFTDYYTTAVWLGDPNEGVRIEFPDFGARGWSGSGRGGFGGELPADTWGAYMGQLHAGLEESPFAEPEPYGGGRYLRAPGEIDFCDFFSFRESTRNTEGIDSDGDQLVDCFRPVDPGDAGGDNDGNDGNGNGNDGNGNDGNGNDGNGRRGGGNDQPQPTLPEPPTFPPVTPPVDD